MFYRITIRPPEMNIKNSPVQGGIFRIRVSMFTGIAGLLLKAPGFVSLKKKKLTKLIRVQIDIPNSLDHLWKIDVKKSHASPPEAIRNELKLIIDRIAASGKKVYRQKGKKLASSVKVPGWTRTAAEGKILYEINKEHPLIIQFKNDLPDEKQRSFKDLVS